MNLPSGTIKNYVIIFNDRSEKFITQLQAEYLFANSDGSRIGVKIDRSYVKFSSIAKVLTIEEYYRQYPHKKPVKAQYLPDFPPIAKTVLDYKKTRIEILQAMISGFEKRCGSSGIILAQMKNRLAEIEKTI